MVVHPLMMSSAIASFAAVYTSSPCTGIILAWCTHPVVWRSSVCLASTYDENAHLAVDLPDLLFPSREQEVCSPSGAPNPCTATSASQKASPPVH